MRGFSKAFTLVEVNLAIFIMATGVLAMVSLYSLGFRESRQSEEDVAAAGFADAVFAPLVAKLSSTNMTWQGWMSIGDDMSGGGDAAKVCDGLSPKQGWADYVTKVGSNTSGKYRVTVSSGFNSNMKQVFSDVRGAKTSAGPGKGGQSVPIDEPQLSSDYYYGLVATRRGGTITLAFRASRRRDALMAQPIYYTEVHFQGRNDE